MIQKVKRKQLNMSMLEIVITLGILTIISVFLMRLFLGANSLETKARDISKACILAENTGETIKAASSYKTAIQELGLARIGTKGEEAIYKKYYDGQWREQSQPAVYTMEVRCKDQSYKSVCLVITTITVTKDSDYAVIRKDSAPLASIVCKSCKEDAVTTGTRQ